MNFKHAVGFLFLGTVLGLMPRLAPGWCHVTSLESASTRELWLQFMSFVQIGLAGVYFLGRLGIYFATVMETPTTLKPAYAYNQLPDEIGESAFALEHEAQPVAWAPVRRVARPALVARRRRQTVLPIPVAFESGLLEQSRAA